MQVAGQCFGDKALTETDPERRFRTATVRVRSNAKGQSTKAQSAARGLNVEVAVLSAECYYKSITHVKVAEKAKRVAADKIFSAVDLQWASWYMSDTKLRDLAQSGSATPADIRAWLYHELHM